jgi:hypothetical protein
MSTDQHDWLTLHILIALNLLSTNFWEKGLGSWVGLQAIMDVIM